MTEAHPLGEQEQHVNALRTQLRTAVCDLVDSVHPEPKDWAPIKVRLDGVADLGRRALAAVELLRSGASLLGASLTAESEVRLAAEKRMMFDAIESAERIKRRIEQVEQAARAEG